MVVGRAVRRLRPKHVPLGCIRLTRTETAWVCVQPPTSRPVVVPRARARCSGPPTGRAKTKVALAALVWKPAPQPWRPSWRPGGMAEHAQAFFDKPKCAKADMIDMPELSTQTILKNLEQRFDNKIVYTYIGDIVVSVNPFCPTGNKGPHIMDRYQKEGDQLPLYTPSKLPPHVFALVGKTYKRMVEKQKNQSILISGESGAGKTEAMKLAIQHFAVVTRGEQPTQASRGGASGDVARRVMATNPLMEPIGNAKTTRNNNSSRFGKHIDIEFDDDNRILGAKTTVYLLEKPRICQHMKGEVSRMQPGA